jgi:hypothetical protein
VRLILRPRAPPHKPLAAVRQPSQRPRPLVRSPHLVEQPGGEQPCKRTCVEAIGLRPGLGDRAQLAGVGDHHPDPMPLQDGDDPVGPSCRLERHGVARKQALREQLQRRYPGRDPARRPDAALLSDRDLAKVTVHVQTKPAHARLPSARMSGSAARHTTRTDPCSRHTGSSRRGGHEQRRARSSSVRTACPSASSLRRPCPGSTMLGWTSDGSFMPRQRQGLSLARLDRGHKPAHARATLHPHLSTTHERQGRTLHPNAAHRIGLRAQLHLEQRPCPSARRLPPLVQQAPTAQLAASPATNQPRLTPPWSRQLERARGTPGGVGSVSCLRAVGRGSSSTDRRARAAPFPDRATRRAESAEPTEEPSDPDIENDD